MQRMDSGGKGMQVRDFEKRDAGRGLWEKGFQKGTAHYVRKRMREGNCGKRDVWKGLWEKGCWEGDYGKWM